MLSETTQTNSMDWKNIPAARQAVAAVPGLTFRGFADETDFPKMLAVIMDSREEDEVERVEALEDIVRTYTHLTNCDPATDMVFAEVYGEVVGYGRLTWWTENTGLWVYTHFGFLKPAWRRRGIGRAMLYILQRRVREIAAGHMVSGERAAEAPAVFRSFASESEKNHCALLASEGFQPVRYGYTMLRPDLENIPDLPLPPGIEVRPVNWVDHRRQIFDAEQEAFRDHWGFSEPTEESYHAWVGEIEDDPDLNPSLWRVAWQGNQVVGMVRSFILADENREYSRHRGYTEHISVRRPWRRQGVARALIALSLQALKERGMTEAALGVDTENTSGALRIYEFMGFRPVKVHITYDKPLD